MSQVFRQGFIFPLAVSILLLTGFLGYFLKSEYEKEKDAIVLEERDAAFVKLFTTIKDAGPVKWTKDSLGNEIFVKLQTIIDTANIEDHDKYFDSVNYETEARFTHHTQVITIDETLDSIKTVFRHNPETLPTKLKIHKGNYTGVNTIEDTNQHLQIMEFIGADKGTHGIMEPMAAHIKPWSIWKRLFPQVLFSILLLGSVTLAYYMIANSLRKERQLAHLRNDFMSNMSHELKTPVSTISVALEALSTFNAADDERLRKEYIDISKTEVERLGLLVDKALNISLFEQGKFIYDKQQLDLNNEIQSILKTLSIQLDNQNVDLSYNQHGNNFNIQADKTHIINVVHNLIENAIKYSDSSPEIKIILLENADNIELTITDNGKGIPPEYQSKVFDKFFRVPQGDTHNVKGHGLGLSYVKEVVNKHEGTIKIKSGVDAGTTFIIELPKVKAV